MTSHSLVALYKRCAIQLCWRLLTGSSLGYANESLLAKVKIANTLLETRKFKHWIFHHHQSSLTRHHRFHKHLSVRPRILLSVWNARSLETRLLRGTIGEYFQLSADSPEMSNEKWLSLFRGSFSTQTP